MDCLHEAIINSLADGVYYVGPDQSIQIWNDAAQKITGYRREEIIGKNCAETHLDQIDLKGRALCGDRCPLTLTMQDGRRREVEMFIRHKRGYRIPVHTRVAPICEGEKIIGAVALLTDNSVRTQDSEMVSSLTRLVMTDQLTGLSNKRHSETLLETKFDNFKRFDVRFGVLFINLDDFTQCNEAYGFEAGNEVLIRIADSFRHNVNPTNFIGRWGGEEFLGGFELKSLEHLKHLAEKMRVLIENTKILLNDQVIHVTASIGATMANEDDSVEQVVDRAASLMHVSKISGKNCITIG